jgi:hypothetical protein
LSLRLDVFAISDSLQQGDSTSTGSPHLSKMFVCAALFLLFSSSAQAHPHHRHSSLRSTTLLVGESADERIVGGRPAGCPHAFCGCEASLYKFGRIIPELNLASNWRRFPRASPAPGMAAVRSGHVMILQQHIDGNIWSAHDGNSGGHMTREHLVSISGYLIVDPTSASAMARYESQPAGVTSRERRSVAPRTRVASWTPVDPANPLSISTH